MFYCGIPQTALSVSIGGVSEIFKRPYRVRRASYYGKEVTLAPETPFYPGEEVVQFFDDFALIVPKGAMVDESLLRRAVTMPRRKGRPSVRI